MSYLKKTDNMSNWRATRNKKASRGSHTAGSTKGLNCHADGRARIFCTRNRSHKLPGYEEFFTRWNGLKK